jgi:peptidoglycan/xylan/chitin deacetylase (PgdA/CDA1 family)
VFLRFPEGKTKAVTLSYDDNCIENIRFADTITKYGLKGTFNLNIERPTTALKQADVEEHILKNGHEIAVHGLTHGAPGIIRPIEGIKEVLNGRLELENRYNMIVRGMAYPDSGIVRMMPGNNYETIRDYLVDLGIAYSRTLGGDNDKFELPTDWYAWTPSSHHINKNVLDYIDKFNGIDVNNLYTSARFPRLFYLWGHAYEFERNQNWDLLQTICEKLAGKEDVWYATNIEIYNYVEAYKSLIFNAEGNKVFNPTLYEIWFDVNKQLFSIKPGETIKIQ